MNDTLTVYKDGQTKIIPKTLESDYVRGGLGSYRFSAKAEMNKRVTIELRLAQ